jgi:hypothetical protein
MEKYAASTPKKTTTETINQLGIPNFFDWLPD